MSISRADVDAGLIDFTDIAEPGAPPLTVRGEKLTGAAIIGNLEQQLLADSALTPVKAVALTAAFRSMYQSMAVPDKEPGSAKRGK